MVRHVAHIEIARAGDAIHATRRHAVPVETENVDCGLEREVIPHPLGVREKGLSTLCELLL
jgi:hypothetical protein